MRLAHHRQMALAGPEIDLRSVPRVAVDWPAAFRLRPTTLPQVAPLLLLGDDLEGLEALKDLTSPAVRHRRGTVPLPFDLQPGTSASVVSAFANSLPEWRFAGRGQAHMLLASTVTAAVAAATEVYGQFMLDTEEKPSVLSFMVERFRLSGSFADVSDSEVFPACYDSQSFEVSQQLVASLADEKKDGLIYDIEGGQGAVVLQPGGIVRAGIERGLGLQWNGTEFSRLYDYRDMYWRELGV